MTKIEDMSEPERQSWITILADGAVFIYFWQAMTQGLSLRPVHTDMAELGAVIIGVILATIILHAAIATVFALRKRDEPYAADERDVQVERLGAHWGYRLLQLGVGCIVVTLFLHAMIGETYAPPLEIATPAQVIFFLLVVSYVADLVKHGVMIFAYRRA